MSKDNPLRDILFAQFQYILPHHTLSRLMLRLTRLRIGWLKKLFIPWFIRHFKVDMSQAEQEDWREYESFNHFFTRALKADARPLAEGDKTLLCPVDGCVSQAGQIERDQIFQAKGHSYSLQSLLGESRSGSDTWSNAFENGSFATLYLSPRDYHRIHMPLSGKLKEVIHVPGRLFSVNPATVRNVPGLFARNERVAAIYETEIGPMAMILVGAIFVSSIETVWQGTVTPPTIKHVRNWDYTGHTVNLQKGEEMGRFNMGSTVILLFGPNQIQWDEHITAEQHVQMGEALGKCSS